MRHEDFRRQLDDLVDGIVGEPERLEMEQHAAGCPECARELEAVRAVVDSARALPRDIEPARDLWRGIEAEVRSPAAPQPRSPGGRISCGHDSGWPSPEASPCCSFWR